MAGLPVSLFSNCTAATEPPSSSHALFFRSPLVAVVAVVVLPWLLLSPSPQISKLYLFSFSARLRIICWVKNLQCIWLSFYSFVAIILLLLCNLLLIMGIKENVQSSL